VTAEGANTAFVLCVLERSFKYFVNGSIDLFFGWFELKWFELNPATATVHDSSPLVVASSREGQLRTHSKQR
jgi:hypothetical protein